MLSTLGKSGVDGVDVLVAAHLSNPGLGGSVDRVVEEVETDRVPSLSDFGISSAGDIEVVVNLCDNRNVGVEVREEGLAEHDLLVGSKSIIDLIVTWRACSVKSNISHSEIDGVC